MNLSTSAPFGSAGQVGGIEEVWVAKIRIAIVGAGNCASSLIQGIEFYRRAEGHDPIPGLMHLELGGYHLGDIYCVPAFAVSQGKGGPGLADALHSPPNNTIRFAALLPTRAER